MTSAAAALSPPSPTPMATSWGSFRTDEAEADFVLGVLDGTEPCWWEGRYWAASLSIALAGDLKCAL